MAALEQTGEAGRERGPVATIRRLYEALDRHDGDAAAACYTDDAAFTDPAFGRLDPGAVKAMWRMLCERSHDLRVELRDCGTDGDGGWARWSASYTFSGSGRSVLNDVRSRFRFSGALIAEQVDTFSLRRWGGQAIGRRATMMGTTPLLGYVVRRQARRDLSGYARGAGQTGASAPSAVAVGDGSARAPDRVFNVEGKATAITVLTPVRPGGRLLLALVFWVGRNVTATLRKLQLLSFIHYARWAVIRRFPDGGSGERCHYPYLLFESNFNGTWDQYIDAFSEIVPSRMKGIWGTSYGFPGPIPVEPFKDYIRRNEYIANHYWSAYPQATTTEVIAAVRVAAALDDFRRRSATLDPHAFKAAYDDFLSTVQRDL